MSRGLGWVQSACLVIVKRHEGKRWPSTYTIAADVYQVKPDRNGDRLINDAQHVAVKRALEGLQRKGMVFGFRDTYHRRSERSFSSDIELCHVWLTEKGLARWLAELRADAANADNKHRHEYAANMLADLDAIAKRARHRDEGLT